MSDHDIGACFSCLSNVACFGHPCITTDLSAPYNSLQRFCLHYLTFSLTDKIKFIVRNEAGSPASDPIFVGHPFNWIEDEVIQKMNLLLSLSRSIHQVESEEDSLSFAGSEKSAELVANLADNGEVLFGYQFHKLTLHSELHKLALADRAI